MVQANIDNSPVSITLGDNEQTTVPTGEVWKATITVDGESWLMINGTRLSVDVTNGADDAMTTTETVVTGGDTIRNDSGNGVHIGGFVVSS